MIKTYRPFVVLKILYILSFLLIFAVWSLFFVYLYQLGLPFPILILLEASLIVVLLLGAYRIYQVRLEISDKGMTYFSGYYIISTSWDNVARMGKRVPNNLLNLPVEGLILRAPSAVKPSLMASISWSGGMSYYEVDYSRSIPLQGIWSSNWRKSKLMEDLKRYVPELF